MTKISIIILLFVFHVPSISMSQSIRGGCDWAHPVMRELKKEYSRNIKQAKGINIDRWDDEKNIEKLCSGKCHILYHRTLPADKEKRLLKSLYSKNKYQKGIYVGNVRVVVIANQENSLDQINLTQIRELLRVEGKGTRWLDFHGNGGMIKTYGEGRDSTSRSVIRHVCMMLGPKYPTGFYNYRDDFVQCDNPEEVIKKVKRDTNGIGFILCPIQPIRGLKILSVGKTDKGPFIAPKLEPLLQPEYLLSEPLILYLHPKAPPLARQFCEFAVSEAGAKIAGEHGLITPWHTKEYEGQQRLKAHKSGKGPRVLTMGVRRGRKLMQDLVLDYVKAKAVVQLSYSTTTGGVVPVAQFLQGQREVLLLDGPPSGDAMRVHGAKWRKAEPKEHILAGRAVAIVVHATNKLDSLTIPQVRGIFTGDISDWRHLAAVGEQTMADTRIHRYGVRRASRTAALFHRIAMEGKKADPLMHRMTTEKVLSGLSADPQGIGFLGAGHLPDDPAKAGLKVLAIVQPTSLGTTGKAKPVKPTPENVLDGQYPIAERLHLYVSPKASQATQDFITYITTPGNSMETFQKHELLPKPMPKPKPAPKAKEKPKGKAKPRKPAKAKSKSKKPKPKPSAKPKPSSKSKPTKSKEAAKSKAPKKVPAKPQTNTKLAG